MSDKKYHEILCTNKPNDEHIKWALDRYILYSKDKIKQHLIVLRDNKLYDEAKNYLIAAYDKVALSHDETQEHLHKRMDVLYEKKIEIGLKKQDVKLGPFETAIIRIQDNKNYTWIISGKNIDVEHVDKHKTEIRIKDSTIIKMNLRNNQTREDHFFETSISATSSSSS